MITHTEERILKLARRGLTVSSIARKIGRPGIAGEERVREAFERAGIEETPQSWFGEVHAAPGHLLLGGVPTWRSSRFEKKEHAEQLTETIVEGNRDAGRKVKSSWVIPSMVKPDILAKEVDGS